MAHRKPRKGGIMGRKTTNKKEKREKMRNTIRRIFAYLLVGTMCLTSIFVVKNSIKKMNSDVSSLPKGSYQYIVSKLIIPKNKKITFPTLTWISDISKETVLSGIELDHWCIHNYMCEIKFRDDCENTILPENTKIVFNGQCDVTERKDGLKTYRLYVSEPSDIEYIECSSYIEYYFGIIGDICHITDKVFTGMTVKEFNRTMVIASKLQVAKNGETTNE
jgi:hypothetical protein